MDLAKLKPGMMIAEDVYNFQGLLLLKAGAVISEKNIRVLKTWGVTGVEIDGDEYANRQKSSESPAKLQHAVETEMNERFINSLHHPIMQAVMKVAIDIKIEKSINNGQ